MKLVILSDRFYEKYNNCPELLEKKDRPYYCVALEVDGRTFAIPLRHHIKHPFCFHTVGDAGLDFSKAVTITDPSYIADGIPWIDSREWGIIKKSEDQIFFSFRKYYRQYFRALMHKDNPRSAMILKYSTLQYFIMPETKPDKWDIRMLEEAKSDPECSIFQKKRR